MIEFEDDRIRFATVHARMRKQVVKEPFLIHFDCTLLISTCLLLVVVRIH